MDHHTVSSVVGKFPTPANTTQRPSQRPPVAAWEGLILPVFTVAVGPCLVLRAGADEYDRGADVLRGDVDAVGGQAELFNSGGLGLCHDAHNSPRSAVTHQRSRQNQHGAFRERTPNSESIRQAAEQLDGVASQGAHRATILLGGQ